MSVVPNHQRKAKAAAKMTAAACEVVLVRHGETDWNLLQRIQGQSKEAPPLNATGCAQAEAVQIGPACSVKPTVPILVPSFSIILLSTLDGESIAVLNGKDMLQLANIVDECLVCKRPVRDSAA